MMMRKVSDRQWLSWPGIPFRARLALLGAALLLLATAHNAAAQCRNEYLGGLDDNFVPPTEPALPDPALAAYGSCGTGGVADFDASVSNKCVAHTFPALGTICGATLCFRAKPTGDVPANDGIQLGSNPPFTYSVGLKNLPESGGTWDPTNNPSGATFCLDLANLPNNGTNIIPQISGNDLDVYIQDDTEVDFMTLTTTCCGCDKTYPAGLNDNFAPPPEPATPDAALAALPCGSGTVDFDVPALNQCIEHTFEDLGVICGATLTVRLKPTGGSTNDELALAVDDGGPPTFLYISNIFNLPNASPPTGGTWDSTNNPTGSTFVLDLANLPPGGPAGTNIINQISQAGRLDVLVEDDTAVDYITLTTTCCPHQKCYKIKAVTKPPSSATTRTLEDQFGIKSTSVKLKPYLLCTPVDKGGEDDKFDEKNHTVCYKIKEPPPFPGATVSITNQFGTGQVQVLKPATLCVPSSKTLRHCVGGANNGALCADATECPGGACQF